MSMERIGTVTPDMVDAVIRLIPEEWDLIMFYAQYEDGAADHFFYYFRKGCAEFVPSMEMAYILDLDHDEWSEQDRKIDLLIEQLADELQADGEKMFSSLTFFLSDDDKLKVYNNYDPLPDRPLSKIEESFAEEHVYPEIRARQKSGVHQSTKSGGLFGKLRSLFR
ncbi:immunity protein YezG family protein [Edaphobacillus lindanitolerans]|uniref:DUF600 family protein n=1 Tax=Edaphobacillus lindanitolerans TaxID=550447 RepID=A0A1U7PN53_9BACI|nr:immunity protein YezG family protein [Edaphobacillus lindanitolerans]SIT71739.1 Protein of unknown function, DUF600 [Edaphobacillus lindanitolerans]